MDEPMARTRRSAAGWDLYWAALRYLRARDGEPAYPAVPAFRRRLVHAVIEARVAGVPELDRHLTVRRAMSARAWERARGERSEPATPTETTAAVTRVSLRRRSRRSLGDTVLLGGGA